MSRSDPRATCETCRFWEWDTLNEGFCRIRSPFVLWEGRSFTRWPRTHKVQWCGEHQYDPGERAVSRDD